MRSPKPFPHGLRGCGSSGAWWLGRGPRDLPTFILRWVFFPLKTAACLTRFRCSGVPVGAFSPASVFMPEDIWVFFEAVVVDSVFPRFLLGEYAWVQILAFLTAVLACCHLGRCFCGFTSVLCLGAATPFSHCEVTRLSATSGFFLCGITSRDCAAQPEWFGGCHLGSCLPAGWPLPHHPLESPWRPGGAHPLASLSAGAAVPGACPDMAVCSKRLQLCPHSPASEQAPFPPAGSSGTLEGPGESSSLGLGLTTELFSRVPALCVSLSCPVSWSSGVVPGPSCCGFFHFS